MCRGVENGKVQVTRNIECGGSRLAFLLEWKRPWKVISWRTQAEVKGISRG